jgi:hypothetical protein
MTRTSLAEFSLNGTFWENLKSCEEPAEYTPALFLERLNIADGYGIKLNRYAGTMIIYVEAVAPGAKLKFMRAIAVPGLTPEQQAKELAYVYSHEYGDEHAEMNKVYDLEPGDRILVSEASYTLYCDHEVGASVLLSGIDPGYHCGGRPCLNPGP